MNNSKNVKAPIAIRNKVSFSNEAPGVDNDKKSEKYAEKSEKEEIEEFSLARVYDRKAETVIKDNRIDEAKNKLKTHLPLTSIPGFTIFVDSNPPQSLRSRHTDMPGTEFDAYSAIRTSNINAVSGEVVSEEYLPAMTPSKHDSPLPFNPLSKRSKYCSNGYVSIKDIAFNGGVEVKKESGGWGSCRPLSSKSPPSVPSVFNPHHQRSLTQNTPTNKNHKEDRSSNHPIQTIFSPLNKQDTEVITKSTFFNDVSTLYQIPSSDIREPIVSTELGEDFNEIDDGNNGKSLLKGQFPNLKRLLDFTHKELVFDVQATDEHYLKGRIIKRLYDAKVNGMTKKTASKSVCASTKSLRQSTKSLQSQKSQDSDKRPNTIDSKTQPRVNFAQKATLHHHFAKNLTQKPHSPSHLLHKRKSTPSALTTWQHPPSTRDSLPTNPLPSSTNLSRMIKYLHSNQCINKRDQMNYLLMEFVSNEDMKFVKEVLQRAPKSNSKY